MDDDDLLRRFDELRSALRDRDLLEGRLREAGGDEAVRELSLTACERVLLRRVGLYRCLIRHGWTPPPPVVRQLLEDEAVLTEPLGSAGG